MIDNGTISVIVPVFNPGEHFVKCLDSIVNQTYKNLEIILIDDGSTDGSGLICDEYALNDSRIVCIHQKNSGVSKARNVGLEIATGDFLHFPDSDDYLDLDAYEYIMNIQREYDCDAVTFEYFVTYQNHEITHKNPDDHYGLFYGIDTQVLLFNGCQFCCNKIFKCELTKDIRFREDIFRGEDLLFAAQLLKNANKVWFEEKPFYHYVQSEESACRGVFRPSQFTVLKLYEAYKDLYINEYKEVWPFFLLFMQDVLISLYYDVWSDVNSKNYTLQMDEFYNAIVEHYNDIKTSKIMSKKQMLKYYMFKNSPKLFCVIHKTIHRL